MRRLAFLLAGLALLAAGCGKGSSQRRARPPGDRRRRAGHRQPVHRADDPPGRRARDLEPERRRRASAIGSTRATCSRSSSTTTTSPRGRRSRTRAARSTPARSRSSPTGPAWTRRGSWRSSTGVSIAITHDGGTGLVDAETRPNVFRIAPTNHGIAFRYAEYLIPKKLKVALLSDDSAYGREGAADIGRAFSGNPESVALKLTLPAGQTDLTPQILRARRSGATALLVWGQPPTIASVLSASRSIGWKVPVYTPPTGSDPFIRQQLADHPEWVDGLTFAGGRLTAEVGTGPFVNFQSQYESTYGADKVGVKNSQGQPVVQPPEFAMYSYDFVHVLVAAIAHARIGRAGTR